MNLRHNPPVQSGLWSICRCIWAVALSCIFSDVAVMNLWSKQLAVVMIMRDSWESLSLPPTSLPLVRGSTLLLCFCLPVILCRTCSHLIPFAMCAHALQHVTPGYVMCLSSSESRSSSFSWRDERLLHVCGCGGFNGDAGICADILSVELRFKSHFHYACATRMLLFVLINISTLVALLLCSVLF